MYGDDRNLVLHHIMFGTNERSKSDRFGCWCYLTVEEHELLLGHITQIERNGKIIKISSDVRENMDRELKQRCQREFVKVYGMNKWWDTFHHNYL